MPGPGSSVGSRAVVGTSRQAVSVTAVVKSERPLAWWLERARPLPDAWLDSRLQPPAMRCLRAAADGSVAGFLLLFWVTWVEFPAPSSAEALLL